jgi:hypothetical protein
VNNHAAYRCRHGARGAIPEGKPRIVYVHERKVIAQLADQLEIPHEMPEVVSERVLEYDALVSCAIGGLVTLHLLPPTNGRHSTTAIPYQRLAAEIPAKHLC